MKKVLLISILQLFEICLFAQNPKVVLLSKSYGNGIYEKWLLQQNRDLKLVSMYHVSKDSVEYWLRNASGFLMTGGEDVYPGRYGREQDTSDCGEFDLRRDSLEFQMLEYAFSFKKPVFGICRGLQIINIYLKGTLIVDIPTKLGVKVRHREEGPTEHEVSVIPKTGLAKIAKVEKGIIASNHHQGIDKLGKTLVATSSASDGLIESFEAGQDSKMPFLMAVQWHPEKMKENDHLSRPLAEAFVKAISK